MIINKIPVGYLKANCYVLEKNDKVIIIDPGDEYQKIKPYLKNKQILKILITHKHQDHIGALNNFNQNLILKKPEEKTYQIGSFTFEVINAKGHTNDSKIFYFKNENTMFTGDFLFKNSIGRTDMPTGNYEDMQKSLKNIKKYKENIKIYPGHGPATTLNEEKENNYFLKNI